MTDKLLILHHELLYPAFAGAALFNFADNIVRRGYSNADLLWAATAFWFLAYFSVAFLALAEANETDERRRKFGVLAFVANLIEIGIILYVSVSIVPEPNRPRSIDYILVYWSWILLPFTGGISNFCSDRKVRTTISLCAIGIGARGYIFSGATGAGYGASLFLMYVLLAVYVISVFRRCPLDWLYLDIDSTKWNGKIRQKLGFAPSPP